MRVLHITTEYPPMMNGGIANAVSGIVSASIRAEIETWVLLVKGATQEYKNGKPIPNMLKSKMGLNIVKIFLVPWDDAIGESVRLVRILKPDILHIHTFSLFPVIYAIKRQIGTPTVFTVHALERSYIHKNPLDYLLQSQTQEALLSLADIIIVLSQTDKDLLLHHCIQFPTRIRVIGNGTGNHLAFRSDHSRDTHLVLYVGRFDNNKGVEDLLASIPYVVKQDPKAHFVMIGGPLGISGEEIQRRWLSNSFPCISQITFTGWIPINELIQWYNKASILVVPSSYDTFPLVILDGMRHGLAVIASATGGALDIIKHGHTGLLFTPKDVAALANCIIMLLKDSTLQRQIGIMAAKEVENNWLWSNIVDKLLTAYKEAVQIK